MSINNLESWVFIVEPYEGESISSLLGRFRQANQITTSLLGQLTGLGATIGRWEKLRFNPSPTELELAKLASFIEIDVERLARTFPKTSIQLEPIRLCAACYKDSPYHRIEWQTQGLATCRHHHVTLLSECPNCKARFKRPSLWTGYCHKCFTEFTVMTPYQKSI